MRRARRSPCGLAQVALMVLALLGCAWPTVAPAAGKPAAGPPQAPASAAAASRNTLAAIVEASAEQPAFEATVRHHLPGAARVDALAADVLAQAADFAALDGPIDARQGDLAQRLMVFDLITRLRALDSRIEVTAREAAQWADRLDADLDHIARRDADVVAWLATARQRQAPAELIDGLEAIPARHALLAEKVRASRDEALRMLDRIAVLRGRLAAKLAELETRGATLEERLRAAHAAPLWQTVPESPADALGSLRFVRAELHAVGRYLVRESGLLLGILLATLAVALPAMRSTRRRLSAEAADSTTRRAQALFERPWTAALALALFAMVLLGPRAPLLFYNLAWALLTLPAAWLVRRALDSDARLSLYCIVVVIASIAALDPVLGQMPVAGRVLHILQYLTVAAALWADLRRDRVLVAWMLTPRWATRLTQAAILLLVAAALFSMGGRIGLARLLGHGALGAIGFWLVLVMLAHLVYGLGVGLLDAPAAQRVRIVATHGADLRRWLRHLLAAAVALTWLVCMLALLGLSADVLAWLQGALDAELAIGDASLSIENIVAGLLVLAGTWLLVKLVRLLLDVEILPRVIRRRGVAFAVSAVVRYGLVTGGLLLALAAMGIDLTKVTVLAGALGVGIGFGLQSVVNNFISGLILLVERPVTAGDVVQIGDVQGVVAGIGVRSTTVRTQAGAEVIVPNADLITKVVSNWTLSDSRCRVEIEVNLSSAVDPDLAIRLLESAAAEVDGVVERPAPRAWLSGLRDGQRSYRLHAWIADYEAQTAVQSALRLGIGRRFAQEGVALP